ncbi:MAG TPA: RNA polymerase sigma factor, partial [Pyrinomonadaceae bacterium]|nr:RNA polymerase sigma factor [Pyrinomonadaceae bacterium]
EDLSQEVWLKAFRGLNSFRGEASFYTWLRHITINTFLNHRRAEKSRPDELRGVTPALAPTDGDEEQMVTVFNVEPETVEDCYHRKILAERVMKALGELTPQQRLIFLLKHREGMTYEEISRAFGCSTGTVKKALYRAVTKLRRQFGMDPAPPEFAQCGAARNSLGDSHA